MTDVKSNSSRRAFFLQGSAALGAGVATTVAASAPTPETQAPLEQQLQQLRQQLAGVEDREAIRKLHLAFTALMEQGNYDAVAELFDARAHLDLSGVSAAGKPAIVALFADQYRSQNAAVMHRAYRQNSVQPADTIVLGPNRLQASAVFHVEAQLCSALQDDCTAAQMARLQGNRADRRWDSGRFEAQYVKIRDQWKMASLRYFAS